MRYENEKENDFTREPAPFNGAVLGGMPQDAWADTQSKEYVVDDAGLFTDKEKEQLTKMCRKASDACKTDVVILTQSKGLDDKELENYVRGIINESYGYDESSSEPDAIVYVIDMKSRRYAGYIRYCKNDEKLYAE